MDVLIDIEILYRKNYIFGILILFLRSKVSILVCRILLAPISMYKVSKFCRMRSTTANLLYRISDFKGVGG